MLDLPKYRSHKIIGAAKIVQVVEGGDPPLLVEVELPDGERRRIGVLVGWAEKVGSEHHDGDPGYLVQYSDGYLSWSPSKAFEEGYTPLGDADAEPARFCFERDDDGHNYLVPVEEAGYHDLSATETEGFDPPGERIDGIGAWTFTDPKRED